MYVINGTKEQPTDFVLGYRKLFFNNKIPRIPIYLLFLNGKDTKIPSPGYHSLSVALTFIPPKITRLNTLYTSPHNSSTLSIYHSGLFSVLTLSFTL